MLVNSKADVHLLFSTLTNITHGVRNYTDVMLFKHPMELFAENFTKSTLREGKTRLQLHGGRINMQLMLKFFKSDHGGEYTSRAEFDWCKNMGIERE